MTHPHNLVKNKTLHVYLKSEKTLGTQQEKCVS